MKKLPLKEAALLVRVTPEFKAKVEKYAAVESQTLSAYVTAALNEKMRRYDAQQIKHSV